MRAVRKCCIWWSSVADGKDNTRSQLESTCSRIWTRSWNVVSIPTVICMWNMEPYSPWKDRLWSWFRKWFSPGLGVLPRTAGFHRGLWSKHTWKRDNLAKTRIQHLCWNALCSHVASLPHVSISLVFSFTCHNCFHCNSCDSSVSLFKKPVQSKMIQNKKINTLWPCS